MADDKSVSTKSRAQLKRDAVWLLRDDHKTLRGLFRQLDAIGLRAPEFKHGVIDQIFMELEIHSRLEEELFYPEFGALADFRGKSLVDNGLVAHTEVLDRIHDLKSGSYSREGFDEEMNELLSSVEDHLTEEETQTLPLAEQVLAGRLEDLGRRMHELKMNLLNDPAYACAKPVVTQNPHGGEQQRKSAA